LKVEEEPICSGQLKRGGEEFSFTRENAVRDRRNHLPGRGGGRGKGREINLTREGGSGCKYVTKEVLGGGGGGGGGLGDRSRALMDAQIFILSRGGGKGETEKKPSSLVVRRGEEGAAYSQQRRYILLIPMRRKREEGRGEGAPLQQNSQGHTLLYWRKGEGFSFNHQQLGENDKVNFSCVLEKGRKKSRTYFGYNKSLSLRRITTTSYNWGLKGEKRNGVDTSSCRRKECLYHSP